MYSNRLCNNTTGANQPVHLCDCGGKWAKENGDIWTIWQQFQWKAKTVTLSEEIQVITGDTQENGRRSRVEKYSEFNPWEMNQVKIRKKYDLSQKGLRHQSSSGTNVKWAHKRMGSSN